MMQSITSARGVESVGMTTAAAACLLESEDCAARIRVML